MSSNCEMCGRQGFTFVGRWYQYDNGEQFIAQVCSTCSDLHSKLVGTK